MEISERIKLLKKSNACFGCVYFINEQCKNEDDCFWKELEQVVKNYEKQNQILEVLKKIPTKYLQTYLDYIKEFGDDDFCYMSGFLGDEIPLVINETEYNLLKEWLK